MSRVPVPQGGTDPPATAHSRSSLLRHSRRPRLTEKEASTFTIDNGRLRLTVVDGPMNLLWCGRQRLAVMARIPSLFPRRLDRQVFLELGFVLEILSFTATRS